MHGELMLEALPQSAIVRPQDHGLDNGALSESQLGKYLAKAADVAAFSKCIDDLLRPLGIDAWSHTDINRVIDILDAFGSWPKELTEQYAREEFYRDDLVLRHMMVSDQPLFVHRVFDFIKFAPFECGSFARNLEIQKLLHRHNMQNLFCIPIVEGQCRSVFAVAIKKGDTAAFETTILRHRDFLLMLGKVMGRVGREEFSSTFHNEKRKSTIPISHKPLQLLAELATKDLTLNEAAEVLDIRISTANQHIAAAKKAFKTNTTHGTVVAAILSGHIILDI